MIKNPTIWVIGSTSFPKNIYKCTQTDCYYWISLRNLNKYSGDYNSLAKNIDELVDGGDGFNNGRIMLDHTHLLYRSFPVMK